MDRIIVIGGGIAGMSAAFHLTKFNKQVTLLEAAPGLGGRAKSHYDSSFGRSLDNGQHLLAGAYKETFAMLSELGSIDKLSSEKRMRVPFVTEAGEEHLLSSESMLPYPFNFISGFLHFKALSFGERISIIKTMLRLPLTSEKRWRKLTADKWLAHQRQGRNSVRAFWTPVTEAVFNCRIDEIAASLFIITLRKLFLRGSRSARFAFPEASLDDIFSIPFSEYMNQHNGEIKVSERVTAVKRAEGKAVEVKTDKNLYSDFDGVVLAVPPHALDKIGGVQNIFNPEPDSFNYSSIISSYVKLKENPLEEKFYGLIGSPIQWVFNRGGYLACVTSSAGDLLQYDNEKLRQITAEELSKYLNIDREYFEEIKIIREKRATVKMTPETSTGRPGYRTKLSNVFLAGDWTDTGLPSVIESAVLSGKKATEYAVKGQ